MQYIKIKLLNNICRHMKHMSKNVVCFVLLAIFFDAGDQTQGLPESI